VVPLTGAGHSDGGLWPPITYTVTGTRSGEQISGTVYMEQLQADSTYQQVGESQFSVQRDPVN
jgi:hypothetical protein